MLLRRMTEHVRDQNWFAIALDFFIVVFGIFIGFQLTNWNEDRKADVAYDEARARLVAESEANLVAIDVMTTQIDAQLPIVQKAISILRACEPEDGDILAFEAGLSIIRGTRTLRLRHSALDTITRNETLLARQDEDERERLNGLSRDLLQAQDTLNWLESWPFDNPVESSRFIGHGELAPRIDNPAVIERPLKLNGPLSEVCKNPEFQKHFYVWERVAIFQRLRAEGVATQLKINLAIMAPAQ